MQQQDGSESIVKLFNNKYRIASARLQTWNYGNAGMYFITICTQHREHYFGKVVNARMQLSEIGKIAETEWIKTPGIRPDMDLELGEFVIMPNHMHGIMIIGENPYNNDTGAMHHTSTDAMHRVSSNGNTNTPANQFAPQSKNLASILRGYKSSVTTYARKHSIPFAWQSRFYDNIIWSVASYHNISEYIINNPAKWWKDRFFHTDDSGRRESSE